MSVVLMITTAPDETRLVPVAPESVFTEHWQRGCSVLGLELVPLCQAGTEISLEELPLLLDELSQLKRWMESPGSCIPEEGVLQRICILISELEQLRGSTAKIWIG